MRILFDIGHPAHVHLFKNLISYCKSRDHFVYVTARAKESVVELLDHYQIPHSVLSKPAKTLPGMLAELFRRNLMILQLHKEFKFDLALGTSVSCSLLSLLHGVPFYNFNEDDDDYIPLYVYLSYPFATKIINPDILRYSKWSSKRVLYPSLHELAYLHPNTFNVDNKVTEKYKLTPRQYIIVRLSGLTAHHDLHAKGITKPLEEKIESLASEYQILYSREISEHNKIDSWDMHQVLAQSKMLISDSQTMTVEAAVLGVPSVRYSSFVGRSSVLEELEHKYELTLGITPGDESPLLAKIDSMLNNKELNIIWEKRRETLLKDKIDFNEWMKTFLHGEMNL